MPVASDGGDLQLFGEFFVMGFDLFVCGALASGCQYDVQTSKWIFTVVIPRISKGS
jgi:hypothetical protein